MLTLNDKAAKVAVEAGATSATDVTGFGLLGHAYNMVRDSSVNFVINQKDIPVLSLTRDMISEVPFYVIGRVGSGNGKIKIV